LGGNNTPPPAQQPIVQANPAQPNNPETTPPPATPSSEKPFDDAPFDAGVEADEDTDPKKFIQQLSGKLGQSLRKYSETQQSPDFELEKFAVNSVLSATHTAEMPPEDQKDIINKVKDAGKGDEPEQAEQPQDNDNSDEQGDDTQSLEPNNDEDVNEWKEPKITMFSDEAGIESKKKLDESKNKGTFAKLIKTILKETFNDNEIMDNNTKTAEPKTKPTTKPKTGEPSVKPSRRNKPFQPSIDPDVKPAPKANYIANEEDVKEEDI
jgi:hypothetical protein